VFDEQQRDVTGLHGSVGDMSLQGDQKFHSTGLIEPESIAPNQLPTVAVHRVNNTDGPGPHDYNFSGVWALKFFEVPDGHDNTHGRKKTLREWVVCRAPESGPLAVPSGYDLLEGGEIRAPEVVPP